jgi:hypothetical protein
MNRNLGLVLAALCLSGCVVTTDARGPLQYESRGIDRDASERVRVNLNIGAGDLKVSSGTQKLMQAYFNYNVPDLKPDIRYSSASGVGDLTVEQPSTEVSRRIPPQWRGFPSWTGCVAGNSPNRTTPI